MRHARALSLQPRVGPAAFTAVTCTSSLGTRVTSSFCCFWEQSAGQGCPRVGSTFTTPRGKATLQA